MEDEVCPGPCHSHELYSPHPKTTDWVITVQGPKGVKHVTVPADEVSSYVRWWPKADPYRAAAYMAYKSLINEEQK